MSVSDIRLPSPSWASTEDVFNFQSTTESRKTRAWDRVPKSPFANRRRGKRVWKRYELRTKETVDERRDQSLSKPEVLNSLSANRIVKRMKINETSLKTEQDRRPSRYITTLRDAAAGTPRRKRAKRKSITLSSHPVAEVTDPNDSAKGEKAAAVFLTSSVTKEGNNFDVFDHDRPKDMNDLCESSGLGGVGTREKSTEPECEAFPTFGFDQTPQIKSNPKDEIVAILQGETSEFAAIDLQNTISCDRSGCPLLPRDNEAIDLSSKGISVSAIRNASEGSRNTPNSKLSNQSESEVVAVMSENKANFPENTSKRNQMHEDASLRIEDPLIYTNTTCHEFDVDAIRSQQSITPKHVTAEAKYIPKESGVIGPSLNGIQPGDESESIKDHSNFSISKYPSPKDGMPSEENPAVDPTAIQNPIAYLSGDFSIKLLSPTRSTAQNAHGVEPGADQNTKVESIISITESLKINSKNNTIEVIGDLDTPFHFPSIDGKDLRAENKYPSSPHDATDNNTVEPSIRVQSPSNEDELSREGKHADGRNQDCPDILNNRECLEVQREGSTKTRSGTQFSDDANMLKEFLNREKARKAARGFQVPVLTPAPVVFPRRSPRKIPADVDNHSPSPQKPRDLASRPGTPPGKQKLKSSEIDDSDEIITESTPCRRSARKRLFTLAKTKVDSDAPSFIPVRRADGVDTIVLHKSLAQELAIITRANTRRNKGQSKPPKVTLQTLPTETLDDAATTGTGHQSSKSVGWDDTLVYYRNTSEPTEGRQEQRKLKHLAVDGTPASQKPVTDPGRRSRGAPAAKSGGKKR